MRPEFFDRAPVEFRPALDEAHRRLPPTVRNAISPRFLCGVSPHFVGLHQSSITDLDGYDGFLDEKSTYETCPHICYLAHSGRQTIVLPVFQDYEWFYDFILHELGHAFDEATGFSIDVPETTNYSSVNREEAFAEAFMALTSVTAAVWKDMTAAEAFRPLRVAMGIERV